MDFSISSVFVGCKVFSSLTRKSNLCLLSLFHYSNGLQVEMDLLVGPDLGQSTMKKQEKKAEEKESLLWAGFKPTTSRL